MQCWECGKSFKCLTTLVTHYQSHNVEATCYICLVTFRRLTSLGIHLQNAHPHERYCENCEVLFDNVLDLNNHKESHFIKLPKKQSYKVSTVSADCRNTDIVPMQSNGIFGNELTESNMTLPITLKGDPPPDHSFEHVAQDHNYVVQDQDGKIKSPREIKVNGCDSTDYLKTYRDMDLKVELEDTEEKLSCGDGDKVVEFVEGEPYDEDSPIPSPEVSDYCPDTTTSDTDTASTTSSTTSSSKSTASLHKNTCSQCGRGPFRNVKVHLFHCSGKRENVQCFECKRHFPNDKQLHEHRMRLFNCDLCGQVFRVMDSFWHHFCPKGKGQNSPTVLFSCDDSTLSKCNMCKALFSTETSLFDHIVAAHSTKVSSKLCIIPNLAAAEATLAPIIGSSPSVGMPSVASLPVYVPSNPPLSSPFSLPPESIPSTSRLIHGKSLASVNQPHPQCSEVPKPLVIVTTSNITGSQPTVLTTRGMATAIQVVMQSLSNKSPACLTPVRPGPPILTGHSTAVRLGTTSALSQVTYQAPQLSYTQASVPDSTINRTSSTEACKSASPGISPLTIVAMFKNDSQEVALKERMKKSWRTKVPYPCRQCGAISRQLSLIISHRYLHRGRRSHRCQCGRTFLRRLHLLRHCMQHAEATSYICVGCGETFIGAKLLVEHTRGKAGKYLPPRRAWKQTVKRKCKMPLTCDCGQIFLRPSAYIWHQLKNRKR